MTSNRDNQQLTPRQIVRLASAISADNMESIVEGYLDITPETVKNTRRDASSSEAFNRDIIKYWRNKNSEDQVQVQKAFITAHVRSTTGGFVYTGVCPGQGYHNPCGGYLSDGHGGNPVLSGVYLSPSQEVPQKRVPPGQVRTRVPRSQDKGSSPVRTGLGYSPRIFTSLEGHTLGTPRLGLGYHPGTGYSMGGRPLAVSRRRTFLLDFYK